jgi:hypothetical protein
MIRHATLTANLSEIYLNVIPNIPYQCHFIKTLKDNFKCLHILSKTHMMDPFR